MKDADMKNAKDYIEKTSPNSQRITSLAYWLTPEGMNDPIIAALLRKTISTATDEDFKEAFDGATKAEAALHLERWELCYMGQWGAPELVKAIVLSDAGRDEALALRAVSMAQSANELPEVFSPKEGIQWAMARGYLITGNICAWGGAKPGSYGHPSNPLSTADAPSAAKVETIRGITKSAVIDAFEGLYFKRDKWSKYLGDIKSVPWLIDCRVTPGIQGSKVSATWNPVLIACALNDKGITTKNLDTVFVGLKDWTDEWQEASALLRD
jgi:hypothetical protein